MPMLKAVPTCFETPRKGQIPKNLTRTKLLTRTVPTNKRIIRLNCSKLLPPFSGYLIHNSYQDTQRYKGTGWKDHNKHRFIPAPFRGQLKQLYFQGSIPENTAKTQYFSNYTQEG